MSSSVGKRGRKIPYRSSHGPSAAAPNSDINVTPLVDVCLVLLIIFMVVTPMLGRGRDVKLPTLNEADSHKEGDQVFVSVDDEAAWIEQDDFRDREPFLARLTEDFKIAQGKASANGYDGPLLFIKADRDTEYGRVRTVMEWINGSELQLQNIALVVELADQAQ